LILKQIIEEEPSETSYVNGVLVFAVFKKLMEQFDPSITEIETVRIYREAYVAGNGSVNFGTVLLVLNEQNFFVRTMQLRGRNESPLINV